MIKGRVQRITAGSARQLFILGEILISCFGNSSHVFDADAEFAGQVDAGFHGYDHVFLQDVFATTAEAWGFVHVQTNAVPQ